MPHLSDEIPLSASRGVVAQRSQSSSATSNVDLEPTGLQAGDPPARIIAAQISLDTSAMSQGDVDWRMRVYSPTVRLGRVRQSFGSDITYVPYEAAGSLVESPTLAALKGVYVPTQLGLRLSLFPSGGLAAETYAAVFRVAFQQADDVDARI